MASTRHRSSATLLALAWVALVLYASLFPFSGWRWPPGQDFERMLVLPWPRWIDVFDLWANTLGYLPMGLLVFVAARRSGVRPHGAWALAALAPSALSYATEVTQYFLPGRHPSAKDWVTNTAGAFCGALLAAAIDAAGALEGWSRLRERWFVRAGRGGLVLLALWPLALLFPAPMPLGLGQVGERLREWALDMLEDVPWAEAAYQMLDSVPDDHRLGAFAEATATALGLLAPCFVAYTVVAPGWRRVVLAVGALLLALAMLTLSTLLNFGPDHALAWLTPFVLPALGIATLMAALLAPVGPRFAAALGLVVLTGLVTLVAQAPSDPYFAQNLRGWEQGRFIHFHGLAQWIGWLWPYAAIAWLLSRLAQGCEGAAA